MDETTKEPRHPTLEEVIRSEARTDAETAKEWAEQFRMKWQACAREVGFPADGSQEAIKDRWATIEELRRRCSALENRNTELERRDREWNERLAAASRESLTKGNGTVVEINAGLLAERERLTAALGTLERLNLSLREENKKLRDMADRHLSEVVALDAKVSDLSAQVVAGDVRAQAAAEKGKVSSNER